MRRKLVYFGIGLGFLLSIGAMMGGRLGFIDEVVVGGSLFLSVILLPALFIWVLVPLMTAGRRHSRSLKRAASALGLRTLEGRGQGNDFRWTAEGFIEPDIACVLRASTHDDELHLEVRSLERLGGLELQRRGLTDAVMSAGGIRTGDPAFDERVAVAGAREREALSLLDASTRLIAAHAVADRHLALAGSVVRWSTVWVGGQELEASARAAAALLRALRDRRGSEREHLMENVLADPQHGVRARSLRLLLGKDPKSPEARRALEHALRDDAGEVRLIAVKERGEDGIEELLELAAGDHAIEVRVEAITAIRALSAFAAIEVGRALAQIAGAPSTPSAVKEAIRAALSERAATTEDERGRLSVTAAGEAGDLSFAREPGALSEPSEP